MEVYILVAGWDENIRGVYSTRERAEEAEKEFVKYCRDQGWALEPSRIEEQEVDPE